MKEEKDLLPLELGLLKALKVYFKRFLIIFIYGLVSVGILLFILLISSTGISLAFSTLIVTVILSLIFFSRFFIASKSNNSLKVNFLDFPLSNLFSKPKSHDRLGQSDDLIKKNASSSTCHVFLYGQPGVGKTTLLSAISNFTIQNYPVELPEGVNKYNNIFRLHLFTNLYSDLEYQIRKTIIKNFGLKLNIKFGDDLFPLFFHEVEGEKLIRTDQASQQSIDDLNERGLRDDFQAANHFLFMTSVEKAKEDDLMISTFIEYLRSEKAGREIFIALIISDWNQEKSKLNLHDFSKENFPNSYSRILSDKIWHSNIFKFRVGSIEDYEENVHKSDAGEIADWLYSNILEKP